MKTSYRERDHTYGEAMLKLRTTIGLTQGRLGNLLGVSGRTVGEWEAGGCYPKTEHFKKFMALALQHQAFTPGSEAAEIRALWKVAHQRQFLDEHWLSTLLSGQRDPLPSMAEAGVEETKSLLPVRDCPASEPVEHAGHETESQAHMLTVDQDLPVIQNLPFPPNPFFTGRETELGHLSQLFEQSARIAITQPISISGLGGIGKTQLALEYAHRCHPHIYRCVFWVNADDRASLETSYLALARLLKLPEEREVDRTVQAVNIWLEKHPRWLLILDNADDLELACSFLPTKAQGHILLTTRSQIVGNLAALVQVEAMSSEEGLLFLLRRCGVLKSGTGLESLGADRHREAQELAELLGGHPLALDQAGAYLEETREPGVEVGGASFAEYRQLYQEQRYTLLQKRGWLKREHPETVATTLEISLQKASKLHPRCAEVLAFCAFLHPDAIPEELLREKSGLNLDLLQFNEVMRALRRYSLLKRDSERQVLSLHRLVQAVIKDGIDTQELGQWIERVMCAVNAAFPEVTFEAWPQCERYLPHALVCVCLIEQDAVLPKPSAQLLAKAGAYLQERGQYAIAEPLLVQALVIQEQHLGAEHPDTTESRDNLAILYRDQGKYEQAEALFQRTLSIREKLLGADHLDTAKTLNNLAILYGCQSQYEQAVRLHQRALSIREKLLGADHPDTAKSLDNLAALYLNQGKYSEALPLHQRALSICEQHLGAEHPDTALCLTNLATLYWQQGKYELAEPLCQRALAICEQHLGAEHPHTAMGLNNLANIYSHQGKYSEALSLHQRALAIREQHLGAKHPHIAMSLNNMAELYWKLGKYELAEPLYIRALSILEQELGSDHPFTGHPLHGLAQLFQDQGKYEQAEALYQRALAIREKRLGETHPETEESRKAYAAFLRLVGTNI